MAMDKNIIYLWKIIWCISWQSEIIYRYITECDLLIWRIINSIIVKGWNGEGEKKAPIEIYMFSLDIHAIIIMITKEQMDSYNLFIKKKKK